MAKQRLPVTKINISTSLFDSIRPMTIESPFAPRFIATHEGLKSMSNNYEQ